MSVASPESRDDIVGFSKRMESKEWLEAEPMMKPQSDKNPDGFDQSGIIQAPETLSQVSLLRTELVHPTKVLASESRLAPRPVKAQTYSLDRVL